MTKKRKLTFAQRFWWGIYGDGKYDIDGGCRQYMQIMGIISSVLIIATVMRDFSVHPLIRVSTTSWVILGSVSLVFIVPLIVLESWYSSGQ